MTALKYATQKMKIIIQERSWTVYLFTNKKKSDHLKNMLID